MTLPISNPTPGSWPGGTRGSTALIPQVPQLRGDPGDPCGPTTSQTAKGGPVSQATTLKNLYEPIQGEIDRVEEALQK